MEAQLSKLKVPELKALLSKHELPQTGKKDDLVKRLVENNISAEGGDDELVDIESNGAPAEAQASTSEAQQTETAEQSTVQDDTTAGAATTETTEKALSPEEDARKRRAERFGLEFKPKSSAPASSSKPVAPASSTTKPSVPPAKKEKPSAIDKSANLGISEEVLAARAAKFGLPEKKAPAAAAEPAETKAKTSTPIAAAKPAPAEITPEMAEQIAAEEEKKRKRAEKFGTGKPASTEVGTEEPDAKKAKA